MKSNLIFLLLIITIIFSCQKDKDIQEYISKFGDTEDMTITNHNSTVLGEIDFFGFLNRQSVYIDINGDGNNNLQFVSKVDSVKSITTPISYVCKLIIIDSNLNIAEIPNSGVRFEHYYPIINNNNGTFPTVTYKMESLCDSIFESHKVHVLNYPKYFSNQNKFHEERKWLNRSTYLYLRKNEIGTLFGTPGIFRDTIFYEDYYYKGDCNQFPFNQKRYLAFRKKKDTTYKYGWIEFTIEENNRINIYRSAIED